MWPAPRRPACRPSNSVPGVRRSPNWKPCCRRMAASQRPAVEPPAGLQINAFGSPSMDLISLTLAQAADLVRRREVSAVELTQAHLERIPALDGRLNCFITLTPEAALQRARQADVELRQGEDRGPLHGLPLALKDLYETAGVRTTAGSRFFADHVPEQDSF